MDIQFVDMELPQNIQKYVENVIKKEGYLDYKVETESANERGNSFLSDCCTLTVKGKTKDGKKDTYIFIKGVLSFDYMKPYLIISKAYQNEAFFYNELSQVFTELQEDASVPISDRFKIIKSYGESTSDATILENVAVQGYKCLDRTYLMSLDVAEKALKEIAKFHALSFVIEAKRPDYFEKKIKTVQHPFTFTEKWSRGVSHIAELSARHVKGVSREKLDKFLPNFGAKWREYELNRTSSKYCLYHGDFRLGNLLMKHTDGKLVDLYVVDYQLMNFGNPINDILFFIFLGTDQQFRRQHLNHLVDFYYSSFRSFLEKFNLDSEEIYPKKKFLDDYKSRLDYGLIVGLYFMIFFLADENSIPELDTQDMEDVEIEVLKLFPERMQGIVDDFVEWGYL